MSRSVQARLDDETLRSLQRLVRRLGLTPSEIVRQGIRLVDATHRKAGPGGVIGLGQFASQVPDLGSNKRHLKGFGR